MTLGTVRSFDVHKGYGFIEPDSGGVEVLVTICAVERAGLDSLYQGERVSFDVVQDRRLDRSCAERISAFVNSHPPPGATGESSKSQSA